MPKNDQVVPTEKIAEDRAKETWDGEGGGGARRPDPGHVSSLPWHAPQASRRVGERRREDRRR